MQIQHALAELDHLGEPAGDGDPADRVGAQIFQHAASEIAHVDQGLFGQAVQRLHGGLGGRARGAGDVAEARRARDIDAAMDRMDPGRAGKRDDDARGAEDGQAAEDAEARVHRLLRDGLAAGDCDGDGDIGRAAKAARACVRA